jgi:hypothetical protein
LTKFNFTPESARDSRLLGQLNLSAEIRLVVQSPLCNQGEMEEMRINTLIVALCAVLGLGGAFGKANAQLVLSVGIAPPALPVYVQPEIPGPDYLWTPGYWAWNGDISEYYWVPGAWVLPPSPDVLWTPGYWGWSGGEYVWNAGYWGPTVGFYGGVCYGFGYTGAGYEGGYWSRGSFYYNRSVTNISNTTVINNVYNQPVVNNHITNVSYNGGNGGIKARPTPQELQAAKEQHIAPTLEQQHHQHLASANKDLRASVNNGKPKIAAVGKAGDFSPHNVVAAKAAGSHVKPASFTTGNGLNGAHPVGKNLGGPGNAAAVKQHADRNLAAKSNDVPGAQHHDANHGANKNAVANLNAGPGDNHRNLGSSAAHTNGAPTHMNGAAAHMNGAPPHMNGAPPHSAAMMKMPGGPAPHAQPHPNMPRPAAHVPPPGGPRPAAQPHPAGQQKKDQPHG